jgi:membrane protein implicated in regulation of membrane protease activity
MSQALLWWIATGLLVLAELATGTFYLLMIALGLAGGAAAAHAGLALTGQLLTAALVGGAAVIAWHLQRRRQPPPPAVMANRDVLLDVGERVHVSHWGADGRARVHYRGAAWSARWVGDGPPEAGDLVIRALDGNELLLGPRSGAA